jgi:Tfp pilus assembly protein PilN
MTVGDVLDAGTAVTGTDMPGPAVAGLATMPRVDLMPPEIGERSALRRLQAGCAAALVLSVAVVGGLWFQAHHDVDHQRSQVSAAQDTQRSVQAQVARLADVAAAYSAVENAQHLVAQALGGEVRWSQQLRDLSMTIPANVWLTNMTVTPNAAGSAPAATAGTAATPSVATVSFQGVALDRNDVANWLEHLVTMKGYVGATYSTTNEIAANGRIVVNFTSSVNVTDGALSGRYRATDGD